ncbi:hypothetical protein ABIC83_002468 [Roseateles asaccharophilus]|uniref:DUF1064 domain-containing protein n=1 Tax=Roseateles asaccharophilus TaxID=582607 RepID=UPI003836002D
MPVGTERMSAAAYKDYLASTSGGRGTPKRKNKFGNHRGIEHAGEKYDSRKELKHHQALMLAMSASNDRDRVVDVQRQVPYLLIEKQAGERAVRYIADFVVRYADGRVETHDVKSPPTRKQAAYILKRKMMLHVHKIKVMEF